MIYIFFFTRENFSMVGTVKKIIITHFHILVSSKIVAEFQKDLIWLDIVSCIFQSSVSHNHDKSYDGIFSLFHIAQNIFGKLPLALSWVKHSLCNYSEQL